MTDFSEDPYSEQDQPPPKPRKLPQQSRSRILVDSIKQACMMILEKEGPRGLTVTKISDVSGVAMGSIYQYYPNVDAIVATLYEDLIEADVEIARKKVGQRYRQHSLEASIVSLIRGTLGFHRRMLKLDQDFHRRFYQTFDLNRWFNRRAGDPEANVKVIREILVAHQDEYPMRNPDMEAFTMTAAQSGAILDAVKYHPEYIDDPEFESYVVKLGLGIIGLQMSKPQQSDSGSN
jgi:AcrR family transcriptional regulator